MFFFSDFFRKFLQTASGKLFTSLSGILRVFHGIPTRISSPEFPLEHLRKSHKNFFQEISENSSQVRPGVFARYFLEITPAIPPIFFSKYPLRSSSEDPVRLRETLEYVQYFFQEFLRSSSWCSSRVPSRICLGIPPRILLGIPPGILPQVPSGNLPGILQVFL